MKIQTEPLPKGFALSPQALANKIIAVTGASGGIGRTISHAFASYGATVILIGKTVEKLESVYDKIEQAGHPKPVIFPMDFLNASEANYQELAQAIESGFERLDGLVHCAALLGAQTSISNYPANAFNDVMTVNLTAPFLLTKHMLPILQRNESASIVLTSSPVAGVGQAYWGAYGISKSAIVSLMKTLADELDNVSPVRINSIDPGAVRSPIRAAAFPAEDPATLEDVEVLAPLYLYLMSSCSADVSGKQFQHQAMVEA